jgi:hypothetical protein
MENENSRVMTEAERKEFWEGVNGPLKEGGRSVCTCGHLGDGPNSQHLDTMAEGHGPCKVKGCKCNTRGKFTWNGWKPELVKLSEDIKAKRTP